MVDYISSFTKSLAHTVVEQALPITDEIAIVSAFTGWYAYQYTMTYGPGHLVIFIMDLAHKYLPISWYETYGSKFIHYTAPLYVPSVAEQISKYTGLGVYLSTCLSLNLVAKAFFKIRARKDQVNILPFALGISSHPKQEQIQEKTQQNPLYIQENTVQQNALKDFSPLFASPLASEARPKAQEIQNKTNEITPSSDIELSFSSSSSSIKDTILSINDSFVETNDSFTAINDSLVETNDSLIESELFEDDNLTKGICAWMICC